jgi:HSP20 family protein
MYAEILTLHHFMNSSNSSTLAPSEDQLTQSPRFHTQEDESGVRLQVALPGVRKEDVKLTLKESHLSIEATRSDEVPENWKTHRDSNPARRYGLNVRLTNRLDGRQTTATYEAGVLTLQVPLSEEAKPRQIEVD